MSVRELVFAHMTKCHKAAMRGEPLPLFDGGSLAKVNLRDADLHGINLGHADIRDADLHGAGLGEANLRSADLRGAELQGTYLRNANLIGVNLSDAYLRETNFTGADLSCANLRKANILGIDIRGAYGIASFGPVGTFGRIIYGVSHSDGPRFHVGCFWGTADELRAAIAEKYVDGSGLEKYRASYLLAIDAIIAALATQE